MLALLDELCGDTPSGYDLSDLSATAAALLQAGDITALLADHAGQATGVLVLNRCASLYAGRFGEISELYVKPEFRSAGIGEALIRAAAAIARERGWSRLEVGTPELPAWARTAAFYKRNGFIDVGMRMKLTL
ncbi:hypothetical protein GCM10011487_21350 [Steroidobacter agaridevorans]|uniref:N-acetyltransferase domain-containing protein n=1 Tax=Steroidobacter agaridevorans TaxID=2695856 RepID=A0A829YAP2_9GAMM|nr:hypothetical protein GCM10011487_21350 [Steroidobacter agaridevorans]